MVLIKWIGGKTRLLPVIENLLPKEGIVNYAEPFIGSGSVFFHLKREGLISGRCIISDINWALINLFLCVRDNPHLLETCVNSYVSSYNQTTDKKGFFISSRLQFNKYKKRRYEEPLLPHELIDLGGLFILLNRTCFNGVYRENMKGEFISAYNKKNSINIEIDFNELSTLLKGTSIICDTYKNVLRIYDEMSGFFFYLDPPYLQRTYGKYTNCFDPLRDNLFLVQFIQKAKSRCMMSSGDFPHLFNNTSLKIHRHTISQTVCAINTFRGVQSEIIATNY